MKDAKGHGSNKRSEAFDASVRAGNAAASTIAHQSGIQRIPSLIQAFAKDESGASETPPWAKLTRGYIVAPANGIDPFMDALSHISTLGESL